ncbi:hypothetical protein JCM25156A_32880 [Komagataeibacter kakiaceti JCM 25156]|uniref:hypothetical protein n=1 Tax=Komagataeibacter kakiaceti TaxID=943261 RepID=UPI000471935A|nr:hypothetical protein [Komagataeibacter kakiaceti]MCE2580862.1 hypothetical protein [Komagataeibacter sp. FNDCR1]
MTTDAELIRLCLEFDALHVEWLSYFSGDDSCRDDETKTDKCLSAINARMLAAMNQICATKATTLTGLLSRVRTLAKWEEDTLAYSNSEFWNERLLGAILRDALEIRI